MHSSKEMELFKLSHFKFKKNINGERLNNSVQIAIAMVQAIAISVLISCINFNTLSPWYSNHHIIRMCLICISFVLILSTNIFNRQHLLNLKENVIIYFIAHLIFSYHFINPHLPIKFDKNYVFPLSKIAFHVNFVFYIANSFIFASFFSFINIYVRTRLIYTQSAGLFTYLISKTSKLAIYTKKILQWFSKSFLVFFILYFCVFHNIITILSSFVRITFFYSSIMEILFNILILCANNIAFCIVISIIEYIMVFNISFSPSSIDYLVNEDLQVDLMNLLLLKYHKIAMSFKDKTLKFKNQTNEAKIIELTLIETLNELKEILTLLEVADKSLNSELFVSIPQVNRKPIKKYKTYNLINTLYNKCYYTISCFILKSRLELVLEGLLEIIDFIFTVKEQENIQLVDEISLSEIIKVSEEMEIVSNKLQIDLKDQGLASLVHKLF